MLNLHATAKEFVTMLDDKKPVRAARCFGSPWFENKWEYRHMLEVTGAQ